MGWSERESVSGSVELCVHVFEVDLHEIASRVN